MKNQKINFQGGQAVTAMSNGHVGWATPVRFIPEALTPIPFCERAWRALEPDQAIKLWHGFRDYMRKRTNGGISGPSRDTAWAYKNGTTEMNVRAIDNYVLSLVNAKNNSANP